MTLRLHAEDERIAALLHDVVKDAGISLEELRACGFSPAVIEAVDALTRRASSWR